jgi:hypothetical protein
MPSKIVVDKYQKLGRMKINLREGVGAAIWHHATGGWNGVFFAKRGDSSDKLFQVLYFEIFGELVNIFLASIHPKGVLASLQRLDPNPKEILYLIFTNWRLPMKHHVNPRD